MPKNCLEKLEVSYGMVRERGRSHECLEIVHTNTFSKGANCADRDKSTSMPASPDINHMPVCGLDQGVCDNSGRAKLKETPKQPTIGLLSVAVLKH